MALACRSAVQHGGLTLVDRAALAAYCQSWGRWVEAEEKLKTTPMLLKTATGYVQQSPWLSIANKQLELIGRYMTELGPTLASWSRIATIDPTAADGPMIIRRITLVAPDRSGTSGDTPRLQAEGTPVISGDDANL